MSEIDPDIRERDIRPIRFKTSKDSVYTYVEDGRYIRWKSSLSSYQPLSNITVFFDLEKEEPSYMKFLIATDRDPEETGLAVAISQFDEGGNFIDCVRKAEEIINPDGLEVTLVRNTGELLVSKSASLQPYVGGRVFEEVPDFSSEGTYTHIGHKVVSIQFE